MNAWIKHHISYAEALAAGADYAVLSLDDLGHKRQRELYAVVVKKQAVLGNQKAEGDKTVILTQGHISRFAMTNPESGKVEQVEDLETGVVLRIPRDTPYAIHVDAASVLVFGNAFWMKFNAYKDETIMDSRGRVVEKEDTPT